jgi:cystathionine beta-lyase/cystathionine gamma-synthase
VFGFDTLEELDHVMAGDRAGYAYTRYGNPSHALFEQAVADLESGEAARCTASGQAAVLASVLAVVTPGDRVVVASDVYGGTYSLLANRLRPMGFDVTFCDPTRLDLVEEALAPGASALLAETISNPLMRVADLEELAGITHSHGALLLVDNTFATPFLARPLELGADLVIHSATKYLAGHDSSTAGVVSGRAELIQKVASAAIELGSTLGPIDAWLVLFGLRTMALRVERQSSNAMALARALVEEPGVCKVHYPGLSTHPDHGIAAGLLRRGFGGMLSFELDGGWDAVSALVRALDLVRLQPSLGGVWTTISHPASTSHRSIPEAQREAMGISGGLVRVSCGIEAEQDIISDFRRALREIHR